MPGSRSTVTSFMRWPFSRARIAAAIAFGFVAIGFAWAGEDRPPQDVLAKGADLFAKEWLPVASKEPGGDGLGPVYNETSCIACHHQGGPGGAGPTSTNVEILTSGPPRNGLNAAAFHPGFATSNSTILHRFGVDPTYRAWRLDLLVGEKFADMARSVETEIRQIQQLVGPLSARLLSPGGLASENGMVLSQRNPPPLFGAGLIDALPEAALLAAEKDRFPDFPEIRGRVNHLKNSRLGRFGWKAETEDLREFVLSACANELGLEVPGHHQAASPLKPDVKAKGLDLTEKECDALVAYVRHLPASADTRPAGLRESKSVTEGRTLFETAGCAACHRPRLGEIDAIYSDLLLHDMGSLLNDSGSYYGFAPGSPTDGVKRQEWRTPPLWGYRDSGPYLHDGRAENLEQAVALHGGEASYSATRFFKLSLEERLRVQAFLRSLPPPRRHTALKNAPGSAASRSSTARSNRQTWPLLG
jgi:CxxC motif-containing protein (DUF1111 family)